MQVKDLETASKNIPHVQVQPAIFKPSLQTQKTASYTPPQEPLNYDRIQKLMNG